MRLNTEYCRHTNSIMYNTTLVIVVLVYALLAHVHNKVVHKQSVIMQVAKDYRLYTDKMMHKLLCELI